MTDRPTLADALHKPTGQASGDALRGDRARHQRLEGQWPFDTGRRGSLAGEGAATPGLALSNPLCTLLDTPAAQFTRAQMLRAIAALDIERLTFHYIGGDGELRELRLPIVTEHDATRFLVSGERVDGSSLFSGLVDVRESDLYVVPVYASAFLNPFDNHSLDFMCRIVDRHGSRPLFAPDCVVARAADSLKLQTGAELHALVELEFFLLGEDSDASYRSPTRGGYHAAAPYSRYSDVVDEMAGHLARITGAVKYAHSEAGHVDSLSSGEDLLSGRRGEQHEIELMARPIAEMADCAALGRWIVRNVAHQHGLLATFAPKVEYGVPGNGLHCHLELVHRGHSIMTTKDSALAESALRLIGGLMRHASTLCAFGNTVPTSYLRLVPEQEAPTLICWSDTDRSALVRVPLAWDCGVDIACLVNPEEPVDGSLTRRHQTVEWRLPDGSAHIHLLLAGLAVAAEWGLTNSESLTLAEATRVPAASHDMAGAGLRHELGSLPSDCEAAARLLLEHRDLYEAGGVFAPPVIDHLVRLLRRESDAASQTCDAADQDGPRVHRHAIDRDVMRL